MSDVDVIGGESSEDEEQRSRGRHRHRRVTAKKRPRPASGSRERVDDDAGAAAESSTRTRACHLCEEEADLDNDDVKVFKGFLFHNACMLAVRSFRRVVMKVDTSGNGEMVQAADAGMEARPTKWRETVLPLRIRAGESRTQALRQCARKCEETSERKSYDKRDRMQDTLLLTRRRYIAYMSFWENMSKEDAGKEFDVKVKLVGDKYMNENKERRVKVEDNEKIRDTNGSETIRRKTSDGPPRDRRHNPSFLDDDTRSDASPDERRPKERALRARYKDEIKEEPERRPRKRSRRSRSRSRSSVAQSSASKLPRASSRAPTPDALAKKPSAKSAEYEDYDMASMAGSKSEVACEQTLQEYVLGGLGTSSRWTPLQLMQAKGKLKSRATKMLANSAGSTCLAKKLRDVHSKLSDSEISQLEHDTDTMVTSLSGIVTDMVRIVGEVDSLNSKGQLVETVSKMEALLVKLEDQKKNAQEHLDAMEYMIGEQKKGDRQAKMSVRYQRMKIASRLVPGGVGKEHSKFLAEAIEMKTVKIQQDPAKFSDTNVAQWLAKNKSDPVTDLDKALAASAVMVKDKVDKCVQAMDKNPKWGGAMTNMGYNSAPSQFLEGHTFHFERGEGSQPWACVVKPGRWRYGPTAWPLPGLACLVKVNSDHLYLHLYPVQKLLGKGISLADLHAFLETPTGAKWVSDEALLIRGIGGDAIFVPFGFMVAPLFLPPKFGDAKKLGPLGVASAWVLPLFCVEWAKALPTNSLAAILEMNKATASQQSSKAPRVWSGRKVALEAFEKLLADGST